MIALPPSPHLASPQLDSAKPLTASATPGKRIAAVDRSKADPRIVEAAEGMEAMFLDYMMQVMRQTVPKNEMGLDNMGTQVYQGMLDHEYAQKAAKTGGFGLADQIIANLQPQSYNLTRTAQRMMPYKPVQPPVVNDPTVSDRPTGGKHEGQSVE